MSTTNRPLQRLGFLTIGLFPEDDPARGHADTLDLIECGEKLGFDSAWVRQRHLQHAISSPVAVLAAATQRTSRIHLGTAVIPVGLENPLRLAEDLATVDVLSGGRLNPGVSVGVPQRYDDIKHALYPNSWDNEDFSYDRVERLLDYLRGKPVSSFEGTVGIEEFTNRVQPHATGLVDRLWYGAGSVRSTEWTAQQGLNLLTSNVITATDSQTFSEAQASQIRLFRELHPDGDDARVSQGLVIIPTDNATAAQRELYEDYAQARNDRAVTVGERRMLFANDIVGPSEHIAERLLADPAFQQVSEVAFALPFTFSQPDYEQILNDIAINLAPQLGWVNHTTDQS